MSAVQGNATTLQMYAKWSNDDPNNAIKVPSADLYATEPSVTLGNVHATNLWVNFANANQKRSSTKTMSLIQPQNIRYSLHHFLETHLNLD